MRYETLLPVVEELARLLPGARVDRVLQGKDRHLYLLLRNAGKNFTLLISPDRSLPRLHLASLKPQADSDPHPFVLNLRSRLGGARVAGVALLNQDRVVDVRFAKLADHYHLIFELTGPSANLFFTDAESRIISCFYPAAVSESAARLLLPGALYVLPGKKPSTAPGKTVPGKDESLSPNRSAEEYYERLAKEQQAKAVKSSLRSSITKTLARVERRRTALISDLETARQSEEYRLKGDLVLANLRELKTGMSSADLAGYDGTRTTVELDPRQTPAGNAALYFKKYKKARAGMPFITTRLKEAEEETAYLQSLLDELEQATDLDVLTGIQSGFLDRGYAKKGSRIKRTAASGIPAGVIRTVFRGWEIFVGKSAAGNDHLTTKLARPDDLWLHAEGLPGSHVLIRNPQKTEIPSDILVKAASLAAAHSRGKSADKVPVTYTPARFVRKPKGAKPGLVTLSRRRTIMVKPGAGPLE
jgi:predicted ribosome quality control (RQC) complex YloA/Tae2 family protein